MCPQLAIFDLGYIKLTYPMLSMGVRWVCMQKLHPWELILSFDLNLQFLTSGDLKSQNYIAYRLFGGHVTINVKK